MTIVPKQDDAELTNDANNEMPLSEASTRLLNRRIDGSLSASLLAQVVPLTGVSRRRNGAPASELMGRSALVQILEEALALGTMNFPMDHATHTNAVVATCARATCAPQQDQ